jgi:hypothetical protein
MAIGLSDGRNWVNGTVLDPHWAQNIQDNCDGWQKGTGPTLVSLTVDGTLTGAATALPAGKIAVNGYNAAYVLGAGAGNIPSFSGNIKDTCGTWTITTGSAPSGSSPIITLTFYTSWAGSGYGPHVFLSPGNANAATLAAANQPYLSVSNTQLILNATGALAASTQYVWNYLVFGGQ